MLNQSENRKSAFKKEKNLFNPTIFRFATAFGLSDRMRYDLTINQFVLEMFVKKEIEIYDHKTWRPYCHLKDFARLLYKSFMVNNKIIDRQIFNVGSNENNFNKIQIANAIKNSLMVKLKLLKS